nr:protein DETOXIFICATION 51-like [Ipomoea batatas]
MCNPNTTTPPPKLTAISVIVNDHKPQSHLWCLPSGGALKPQQNPKPNQEESVSEVTKELKSLLNLAFPIALAALVLYIRSMVSMLFLGWLGDTELAAGSLAIAFANITGYSVLSGLALDPTITHFAHTYLFFSLPDLLTNSFFHPIRIYLRAQGITLPIMFATLTGTLFHLLANYFFVFRLRLGVAGVATASATSNAVALAALILYVVWARRLHEARLSWECFTGWAPLVRLAAPSCVSVCLEWWWYEIMIVLCGLLVDPKATVASMGVLIQTTSLLYIFPSSLGFAVSTRVGNELGANRPDKARLSAFLSIFLATLIGLSAMTFATSMRNLWARIFTHDVNILRLTSAALPILGLCELGNCPQTIGCGVLRGSARPSTAANVNLGAFYIVGMPVAIGLGFYLGVGFIGLWHGLLLAQICCAGLMLYVVWSTDWEHQATRARVLTCTGRGGDKPLPRDLQKDQQPLICV